MRRRLILGATYLLVVVIVGLVVPFGATLSTRLIEELGGRVEREAYAVGAAVEDPLERGDLAALQPAIVRVGDRIGGRVLVTDANGVLLADSQRPPDVPPPSYANRPEVAAALRGQAFREVRHSASLGYDLLVSAVPIRNANAVIGAVRISYPMSEVVGSIHRAWLFLAAICLVTLAIGLALATWLARWLTRPLSDAAGVVRRIAAGELDARIPESGPPEVQELARDTNLMTERLSDLVRANQRFAADASHQLRTPLTALRLSLEEAIAGPDPRAEAAAALDEADRLADIVDSLLDLGGDRERGGEPVDVRRIVREVAAARRRDGTPEIVEGAAAGEALVVADRDRVRQVLGNLVDNAVRFADGEVRVTVEPVDGAVRIRVDDDGPGVPVEERQRVFDRFWRGREPRGRGSGLGLAVATELARADGGTISVSENDTGGARFDVAYPAASAAGAPVGTKRKRPVGARG